MNASDAQTTLPKFSIRREYAPQRLALMELVCPEGVCHHCGGEPTEDDPLQFDHLGTREYKPDKLNRVQRLRVYLREWVAAGSEVGKGIVGAHESCNQRLGGSRANQTYSSAQRRRRERGGRGYTARLTEHYLRQREAEAAKSSELEPAPF